MLALGAGLKDAGKPADALALLEEEAQRVAAWGPAHPLGAALTETLRHR